MSKYTEKFGQIADAFESAAAAFRALEGAEQNEDTKSPNVGGTPVASGTGKPGRPKANAAPAVDPKPAAKPKGKPAAAATKTFEELRAKLTEVVTLRGKDFAKEILNGFGVNLLKDLSEDDYNEVYSQAVAALVEDETPPEDDPDDLFGAP